MSHQYTATAKSLHWLMAVLILAAYLLIEQRGLFPRGSGGRFAMMQGHFWAGIAVFVLAWWRLLGRRRHGAPPVTPPLDRYSALVAGLAGQGAFQHGHGIGIDIAFFGGER